MGIVVNFDNAEEFNAALQANPKILAEELVKAFNIIGKQHNEAVRANAASGLKAKSKGTTKVFKYKAADIGRVGADPNKVFTDLYSKWKAADIFNKGGTIRPATGQALTILSDAAKGKSGRRKWSDLQIAEKLHSGEFRIVRTANGPMIVRATGGLTKSGKPRKGTRDEIIGWVRRQTKQRKRIDFEGTIKAQESFRDDAIEVALENAVIRIEAEKTK